MQQVRQLEDGDWVVDLGKKWFRVKASGEVITKQTTWRKGDLCASVKTRPATEAEARFAKALTCQ